MKTSGAWLAGLVVVTTIALVMVPLLGTLVLALFRYDALNPPQWIGLTHVRTMLEDPLFRTALRNSLWLIVLAVPVRLLIALVLGLLLAGRGRLAGVTLVPVFTPVVLPELVWAMAWLWILNPFFGPAAWLLNAMQYGGAQWLLTVSGARTAMVIVLSFLIGELVLVILATRRQIPHQRYELCAVEGAGAWYSFSRVTLPAMSPMLLLLAARDVVLVLQLAFVPALVVTKTGPQFATLFLPHYIYQNAFEYLRFGYAAAMSAVLVFAVLVVLLTQFLLLRRWVLRA
ncbi:sugar ABC transporter permease [uncultured Abyssibacter sp.]|uniref:carbohydrate ABC transporter permease n=1 Tax=uncultured Abyssibacter sp. TaxID=2320202 RepID=UPI0032B120A6